MDAFSLDHDKTGKILSQKGKPLSDPLSTSSFGFGKGGSDTFSNAFTNIDTDLARLHQKFDVDDPKKEKAPSSMPMFSLFSAHAADAKKTEEKKSDTSKIDAPVATAEKTKVTKETTLNINGEIIHPVTPLDLPSAEDQNKMRSVLGLEPNTDAGST